MCSQTAIARHSVQLPTYSAIANLDGFRRTCQGLLGGLGLAAFLSLAQSTAAMAATAPALGTTSSYGIVSSTFTNNANPTNINGSACYTTAPVLAPTTITGATLQPCGTQIADQGTALVGLDSQLGTCVSLGAAVDLSSAIVGGGPPGVIPPGCYSSTGAMSVGSTVTLSGSGVYIFRPGAGVSAAALNTAVSSTVLLAGACAADVYWAPTSATTLGATSTFVGTIIDDAGITMGHSAVLTGRALAAGGTVTTDGNTITVPAACSPPVLPPAVPVVTSIPTLSEWAMLLLVALTAAAGLAAMRRRQR